MFFFSKKSVSPPFADIHSHLIPGIDDGVSSIEESLDVIKAFCALGYKKIITTPHIMSGFYDNTPERIRSGLESVKKALHEAHIDIEMEAAAEYYLDEAFLERLKKRENLLTFGSGYLLFEMPFMSEPASLEEVIFQMKTSGLQPVLAHPERYLFLHDRFDRLCEIVEKGCLLQLNLNSLAGYYSKKVKAFAEEMIDKKLVHFVGSDCHRLKHIPVMQQALKSRSFAALSKLDLLNNTLLNTSA